MSDDNKADFLVSDVVLAQPDAPGWWVFEKETPFDKTYGFFLLVEFCKGEMVVINDVEYLGTPVNSIYGTWRRLKTPWEVQA
jgi:hypothetical protein